MAGRNLLRYQRRTILTLLLIIIGIVAVLLFVGVTGSFKQFMIGLITDSVTGHVQVHTKGFVASIDNLPLNLNIQPNNVAKIEDVLKNDQTVASWSPRIKFGGMLSNFTETTALRVNGVDIQSETKTLPELKKRVISKNASDDKNLSLTTGQILLPVLLANGLKIKVGDTVVLISTNKEGSVNAKNFIVSGILESVTGPGGRDGYININDARELLRIEGNEISEMVIRLKDFGKINDFNKKLKNVLQVDNKSQGEKEKNNASAVVKNTGLEIHDWRALSPFSTIANMIDLMSLFIKIMLISIVLVSVMNVMLMAVFERIREIGTMAAIGTSPRKIMQLFLAEGLMLGVVGTIVGIIISLIAIYGINIWAPTFNFGQQKDLIMSPAISLKDIFTIGGLVIVIAVVATLQPAWKASRMEPMSALRHT